MLSPMEPVRYGRGGPKDALVLDRRRVLATLYAIGATLCLAPLVLPCWPQLHQVAVGLHGLAAATVTLVLLRTRRLPVLLTHVLLVLGTALISGVVYFAGGGAASATYALLFSWVPLYAALFLSLRSMTVHVCLTLCGAVTALALLGEPELGLHVLVLTGISGVSAALVGLLTAQLRLSAERDPLTGLPNRRGLARRAAAQPLLLAGPERSAVLVFDLDRFHAVNVSMGQDGGDALLREVAAALQGAAPDDAIVGRLGGDEFAVVTPLPGQRRDSDLATAQAQAQALAAELLAAVRGPFTLTGIDVEVEARVGIALYPEHGENLPGLLRSADDATYLADRAPDRVAISEDLPGARGGPAGDLALLAELRKAIGAGQLRLHYQPLAERQAEGSRARRMLGVEALVRWQHPTRGLLPPGDFVPQAEPTGLIMPLTEWVLGEALRQTAGWHAAGLNLGISVNLSARLLVHPDLAAVVAAALHTYNVPASSLTLEVTESAVMAEPERARAVLSDLGELGVRVSIDDFGTGYTSLTLLNQLPVHELKIDRSFTASVCHCEKDLSVVHSVLELGHRLGMSVVAEGVEDADTADLLSELGVDVLQGYYLGRPVPAGELLGAGLRLELPPGYTREATGTSAPEHLRADHNPGQRGQGHPGGGDGVREPALRLLPAPRDPDGSATDGLSADLTRGLSGLTGRSAAAAEPQRLALWRYPQAPLARTASDVFFTDVARRAATACGTPMALVGFVDAERHWYKAAVGFTAGFGPREDSFCGRALEIDALDDGLLVVPDALADLRFAGLPTVSGSPGLRFYAGAPLVTAEGHVLGTVCALDVSPRTLPPPAGETLRGLAADVVIELETRRRAAAHRAVDETLVALGRLHHPADLDAAAELISHTAGKLLAADGSTLLLPDRPGSRSYRPWGTRVAGPGMADLHRLVIDTQAEPGATATVLLSRERLFLPDGAHSPLIPAHLRRVGRVASACYFPVIVPGSVLGVLGLWWTTPLAALDPLGEQATTMLLAGAAGHLHRLRQRSPTDAAAARVGTLQAGT